MAKSVGEQLLSLLLLMFYGELHLKVLDFLPLVNADYAGGIIIYDWYSDNPNPQ